MSDNKELNIGGLEVSVVADQLSRLTLLQETSESELLENGSVQWAQSIADYLNTRTLNSKSQQFVTAMEEMGIVAGYSVTEEHQSIKDDFRDYTRRYFAGENPSPKIYEIEASEFEAEKVWDTFECKRNNYYRGKCFYTQQEMTKLTRERKETQSAYYLLWSYNKLISEMENVSSNIEDKSNFWKYYMTQLTKSICAFENEENATQTTLFNAIKLLRALRTHMNQVPLIHRETLSRLFLELSNHIYTRLTIKLANQRYFSSFSRAIATTSIRQVSKNVKTNAHFRMLHGRLPDSFKPNNWVSHSIQYNKLCNDEDDSFINTLCTLWQDRYGVTYLQKVASYLKEFIYGDLCIAGGSVLGAVDGSRYSDIDVFLIDISNNALLMLINQLCTDNKDLNTDGITVTRDAISMYISPNHKPYYQQKKGSDAVKIQIVLRSYKSVGEVIAGFDIDVCGFAVDDTKLYYTPRALHAVTNKVNVLDLQLSSPSYEFRLRKYATRGYNLFIENFDRRFMSKEVPNTLVSRLFTKPYDNDEESYKFKKTVRSEGWDHLEILDLLNEIVSYAFWKGRERGEVWYDTAPELDLIMHVKTALSGHLLKYPRLRKAFNEVALVKNCLIKFYNSKDFREKLLSTLSLQKLNAIKVTRPSQISTLKCISNIFNFDKSEGLLISEYASSQNFSNNPRPTTMLQWLRGIYPQGLLSRE